MHFTGKPKKQTTVCRANDFYAMRKCYLCKRSNASWMITWHGFPDTTLNVTFLSLTHTNEGEPLESSSNWIATSSISSVHLSFKDNYQIIQLLSLSSCISRSLFLKEGTSWLVSQALASRHRCYGALVLRHRLISPPQSDSGVPLPPQHLMENLPSPARLSHSRFR